MRLVKKHCGSSPLVAVKTVVVGPIYVTLRFTPQNSSRDTMTLRVQVIVKKKHLRHTLVWIRMGLYNSLSVFITCLEPFIVRIVTWDTFTKHATIGFL